MSDVTIREFQPGDADAFFELNREWIQRYFWLEPADLDVLWHPQEAILDPGGRIFMAVRGDARVGCCALIPMVPGEYELAKMAVAPSERRQGIGRRLIETAIAAAERIERDPAVSRKQREPARCDCTLRVHGLPTPAAGAHHVFALCARGRLHGADGGASC